MTPNQVEAAEEENEEPKRISISILEENVLETTLQTSPTNISQVYSRRRKKLMRNRTGQNNPGIHIESMTEEQQAEARRKKIKT